MKLAQIAGLLMCACGVAVAQVGPTIDTQPNAASACPGGSATFTVAASGDAPLTYQWYKNSTTLLANETNASLTLTNLAAATAGGYSVIVSNATATATSVVAQLTVFTNATLAGFTNQVVCPGSPAVMAVTASGTGPFTYTWKKGATVLQGPNGNNTYTIASAVSGDGGSYTVEVTGFCTSATNSATLTVAGAPAITVQPAPQATPMGNGAVFSVTATTPSATIAPLSYQWKTNGVDVTGATASSVAISNLTLNMDGTLVSVAVTSCGGTVTSASARLTVTPISGISFDFDTPGQYTNAPYYLAYNNWINGGLLPSALPAPTVFESPIGGTGPFPGSGSLDMAPNQANESTSILLPVSFDFSQTGRVIVASTMFKVKTPTAGVSTSQRSTQFGFVTATNLGINDVTPQGFMTAIVQMENPATAAPVYSLRAQRRNINGSLQESTVTGQATLTVSNWYKFTAMFMNTKTSTGNTASNFTLTVSLQDMGPLGTTPGATNLSFSTSTNSADITSVRNVYLAMRSFENTGVENRDNTYVFTTFGPIFFVQGPQNTTVSQGDRAVFTSYVDGEGPYKYQWQRSDGSGGWTNIPLAGSWNYITPPARTTDNGAQIRVVVTGPANSITSDPATLTVTPKTLAVVSAGSVDGTSVGVQFNQPVDPVTAANPANYSINGTAPTSARVYRTSLGAQGPEGIYVILAPATLLSAPFNVTVSGVQDLSGGAIGGSNSASGNVAGLIGYDVNPGLTGPVGEEYSFGPGKFILYGAGSDIFSGGDGFHYAYTTKTGDFDLITQIPVMDTVRFTAKAGIVARQSLDPFSPSVAVAFDPGPIAEGSGTLRQFTEGTSKQVWQGAGVSWGNNTRLFHPNVWLRLRRAGNSFIRYYSTNGVNWVFDGQTQPWNNYPYQSTVYVGLAVCPGRNLFPMSAQFENYGSFAGYPGATIAITSQPTNFTVNAGSSFTDGTVSTLTGGGAPSGAGELAYVWQRNDGSGSWTNLPTSGATNNTASIGPLYRVDNGAQYRVVIQAPGALSVTSSVFTATVNDTAAPTISSVNPTLNAVNPVSEVIINFNEYLSALTATNTANYLVTNAAGVQLTVLSASFLNGDGRSVLLILNGQLGTGTSSVGISGVQDLNGNNVAASVRTFRSFGPSLGPVVEEYYVDIGTTADITGLTANAMYTGGNPSWISYSNLLGANVAINGSTFPGLNFAAGTVAMDNYGVKAYTYFVPPTNGAYKFWIRGDDFCQLWLNTNSASSTNPSGKVLINNLTANSANYSLGTTLANSITNIPLNAGQPYYMEFLMKETGGSDGFSVMWTDPAVTTAPSTTTFIPLANLAYPDAAAPSTPVISEFYVGFTPTLTANGNVGTLTAATNVPSATTNYAANVNVDQLPQWKVIAGLPDHVAYQKYFGAQPQLGNTRVDNYLGKIYSYFVPPTNGNYKFYLRSDDAAQFFMNTNSTGNTKDPAGKKLLGRLDAFTSAYTLIAQNVTLVGGQRYYMEALWREGGGGDGIAMAVRAQGDTGVPPIGPPPEMIPASMMEYPLEVGRAGAVNFVGIYPGNPIATEGQTLTLSPLGVSGSMMQPTGNGGAADSARLEYGFNWYKNGVRISEFGFTNVTPALTLADNGAVYTLEITNLFSSVRKSVTLTVVADTTAPTVVRTTGTRLNDSFTIQFSEALDALTAEDLGNYQVSGGLQLLSATLDPLTKRIVSFKTGPQAIGTTYTITINNVRDLAGTPNVIAPNTTTSFSTWQVGGNGFYVEIFTNLNGSTIADLVGAPKFINNLPDITYYTNAFGVGPFGADSGLNFYGARITGFFIPTNTGYFRFYTRSDDASMLSMTINGPDTTDPAGKTMLVHEPNANVSFQDPRAISPPVFLNQGQRYFTELLMKEGTGGDYALMTFRNTDEFGTAIGNPLVDTVAELQPASGNFGGAPGNPDLIAVTQVPPSNITTTELQTVSITLGVSVPPSLRNAGALQWQKFDTSTSTFTNIPGANNTNITFVARLADDGAQYRILASFPGLSNSWVTTLHVLPDPEPPHIQSVGSLDGRTLVVVFDKPVDRASAIDPNGYDLDPYFGIPSIGPSPDGTGNLEPDQRTVIFFMDPGAPVPPDIHLHAYTVQSQAQTPVSGTSEAFGVVENLTGSDIGVPIGNAIGGYNPNPVNSQFLINGTPVNLALAVTNHGINVWASGYDIWNAADGLYYAYRQVSGNFDVKVRVQKFDGADQWSKAGIMVRADLTNNSRMMIFGVTPASSPIVGQAPINSYTFQWRDTTGASTTPDLNHLTTQTNPPAYPNAWIRFQRIGSVFNGYMSTNGVDWTLYLSRDSATTGGGSFPATVYLGLATSSHDQTRALANDAYVEYRDLAFPNAPTFTVQPSPLTTNVPIHSTVTFSGAAAVGQGPITYQWVKNGQLISGATGSSLTLTNLQVTDSGTYGVIAANDGGGTLSSNIILVVSNALPVVVPETLSAAIGSVTTFTSAQLLGNDTDPEGDPLSIIAVAGSAPVYFSSDFNAGLPVGTAVYGNASVDGGGGNGGSGKLSINPGTNNMSGAFVISELTPDKTVTAFAANFLLRIADATAEPADGFSFNFAPDLPDAASTGAENGLGTGFSFAVDNYRYAPFAGPGSPAGAPGGGNANTSGLKINYGGTNIAGVQTPGAWNVNRYVPVSINVSADGHVNVWVDGTNVFGNIVIPNYVGSTGRFGIYGRTGGSYEAHFVDDLSIALLNTERNGEVGLTNGVVTYNPGTNTSGSDTFYYLVSDGQQGGTVWDSVTVNIGAAASPELTVTQSGNNLVITWPDAGSFILQETTSLTEPVSWVTSGATIQTVGGNKVATIPITGPMKFFRLKSP